jgi:hypothetical protein
MKILEITDTSYSFEEDGKIYIIEIIREKRNIFKRLIRSIIDIKNGIKYGYPKCCILWFAWLGIRGKLQNLYTQTYYMNNKDREFFSEANYVCCPKCIKKRFFI